MGIQAWMVKSWPVVGWYLPDRLRTWPLFRHVITHVRDVTLPHGRRCGDTLWVGELSGHNVGVSWDWVELRHGVVMLTDPNSIISNLRFLTAGLDGQPPLVATVSLNRLVRHLPWQRPVCAALSGAGAPAAVAGRKARAVGAVAWRDTLPVPAAQGPGLRAAA